MLPLYTSIDLHLSTRDCTVLAPVFRTSRRADGQGCDAGENL